MMKNPEIEAMFRKQYDVMKKDGVDEAPVKEVPFMLELFVFINKEPKHFILSYVFDQDTVFIGSNTMENQSTA